MEKRGTGGTRRDEPELVTSPTSGEVFTTSRCLTEGTGITGFVVRHETLAPDHRASSPHAHSRNDELCFVLAGSPSVFVNGERRVLGPGDHVAFPGGNGEVHYLANETAEEVTFLLVATDLADDEITYAKHPHQAEPDGHVAGSAPVREVAVGPELPAALGEHLLAAIRTPAPAAGVAVVEDLEALLAARIVGLVLYGTASVEGAEPAGDVDLLVVMGEPVRGGLWGLAGEVELDAYVEPLTHLLAADPADHGHVAPGRVLFDATTGELERWLARLAAWRRDTPDPWSAVDRLRTRQWAYRVVGRVARLAEGSPVAARLHEANLLAALPMLSAQARRRHGTSITRWAQQAGRDDPALEAALQRYLSRPSTRPDAEALRALVDLVLAESPGDS